MRSYAVQRALLAVVQLAVLSVLVFVLTSLLPGDAAEMRFTETLTPDQVARLRGELGLDLPAPERFGHWLGNVLTGDLGTSLISGGPVVDIVRSSIGATLVQHPGSALNPARRIGTTLRELAKLHGGVVDEAVRAAQLPGATLKRFPHQFSGGQRQRVALAQALTCRPKVLVLDEPSTGLDSITRWQLVNELRDLAAGGLGILLLSHDLDLVRALATRVVVLSAGRVLDSGGIDVLPPSPDLPGTGTSAAGQPLLEAMSLSASLRPRGRDVVLRDVELGVRAGACLGVVGRSGSGKTTLARCLAGLHERHTGRILLDDEPLPVLRNRTREQTRRVQFVWQESAAPSTNDGPSTAKSPVPRNASADSPPTMPAPRRSPPRGTALVLDLLTELKTRGTALIWIGHDLGLVAAVADQVMVLDAGHVVEQGPPATLTTAPRHDLTRRLVAAARIGDPETPPVLTIDPRSEPRR